MMTSKRRKVKSTRRERDEHFRHKRTRTQSHQNENDRKDSHPHQKETERKDKKLRPDDLSSTIITARRLTVGVKGIFGNAKNSSSVYREIKQRIENRKLSKTASSEIELSLSRIIPSKNKTSKYSSFTSTSTVSKRLTDDENADKLITPAYSRDASCSSVRSVESSIKSAVSCSSKVTPHLVTPDNVELEAKTPYLKIAADIKGGLSNNLIFTEGQLLRELKTELERIFAEKSTLTVNPLFRRTDCEQLSEDTDCDKSNTISGPASRDHSQAMEVSPAIHANRIKNDQSKERYLTACLIAPILAKLMIQATSVPSETTYSSDKHLDNSFTHREKLIDLPGPTELTNNLSNLQSIPFIDQPTLTSSTSILASPTSFSLTLQPMTIPQTVCYVQPSSVNPTFVHPLSSSFNNINTNSIATSMFVQPACLNPVNHLQSNVHNVHFSQPIIDRMHSFQPPPYNSHVVQLTSNPISELNQMTFMSSNNDDELMYGKQTLNPRPISAYDVNLLQMPHESNHLRFPDTNLRLQNYPETNLATGDIHGSTISQEDRSLSLMTIQDILNQPISKLRCYRKRPSSRSVDPPDDGGCNDNVTDFLDCIDLTSDILKMNTKTDDVEETASGLQPPATAGTSDFGLRFGIEKPPLDSPSPPPYYRMSMF